MNGRSRATGPSFSDRMAPLRKVRHLVARFFGVVFSSRLTPREQDVVHQTLTPQQAELFWEQHPIDQRHAFDVAARVRLSLGDNPAALTAALLHDVGKRHSSAGAVTRSLATVLDALRLPLPADWRRYRNHEALGAADLEQVGAPELAVAFARGERPAVADAVVWDALVRADDA